MKEQIKLLTEARKNNLPIYYRSKKVFEIYLGTIQFDTGIIKVRYNDLTPEFVNIMELKC